MLSKLLAADELRAQYRALTLFSKALAEERMPLCEEAIMEAQVAELLAQAARTQCLADRRQLKTELHLVAIASEEGDAVLDETKTRTGLLRQEAARRLLDAGKVQEQLTDHRNARIAAVERRVQSLGRL